MRRTLPWMLTALLIVGCTPTESPTPSPTAPTTTSPESPTSTAQPTTTTTGEPGPTMPPAEATALVRNGASEPQPVASAPITLDGQLKGGTLWVYSVRVANGATRLEWTITHPTATGLVRLLDDGDRTAVLPELVAGAKALRPTQRESYIKGFWGTGVMGNQYRMSSKPHPMFTMYGPLPDGVSTVQVRSALISGSLQVKVDRGPEPVPSGADAVPILGRVVYGDSSDANAPDPLIVSIHGVRRLETTTVVYFSSVFPAGATPRDFVRWGGGSNALNPQLRLGEPFVSTFGLIDRSAMLAHPMVGTRSVKQGCNYLRYPASVADEARVCWALFPPLAEGTTKVDVVVGGQMLVQDVPVESGRLLPTSTEQFPLLGTGWPEVPQASIEVATPEANARSTTAIRDVVVEGAITTSGEQLDLDTAVLFAYNKAALTPAANAVIQKTAAKIKAFNHPGKLRIVGHTDSDGSDAANLDLSKRRAQAVADALKPLLGSGYTYEVIGKGESEPIAPNTTAAGKAMNRRVTIVPA